MLNFFAGLIARLRYLFFIPVLALVALSIGAMASGVAAALALIGSGEGGSTLPIGPAEAAAVVPPFVMAAFLFFLAVAFSSLFLGDLPVPQWMAVRNLHQLKGKLLTFLSIILALFFLGYAQGAAEPISILWVGGGVALVLLAIFVLVRFGHPAGDDSFCREGNRAPLPAPRPEKPPERPERGARPAAPPREAPRAPQGAAAVPAKEWLEKKKDDLRFEVESLDKALAGAGREDRPRGEGRGEGRGERDRDRDFGRHHRRRGRGGSGGGSGSGPASGPASGGAAGGGGEPTGTPV